ncbi:MAG: ABC transporter permease [Deltaproteobacteria bacterium]|nr:ABC transporter permease [Deltaproteobacteria bacterium]
MARTHLGQKRVTPDQIDQWKREHSLDLPYFYNAGWRRIGSLAARAKDNTVEFSTAGEGQYALVIETPTAPKSPQQSTIRLQGNPPDRLVLPDGFDAQGKRTLPTNVASLRIPFQIGAASSPDQGLPTLTLAFSLESPTPVHRVLLEYQGEIGPLARFTQTIFYQRSVQMLFFQYGKSDDGKIIGDEVLKRIAPSLSITVPVLLLGLLIDVVFSMLLAVYRGTYLDYWGVTLCVLLMSISGLFYITAGQAVFAKELRLVPISGFDYGAYAFKFIALPIVIAVVSGLGGSIRFHRTIFLEEINKDYVRTARAKGLPERSVLFIHTLKNALLPILTGLVLSLPFLYAGSLLLESFFAIPGMGSYMLDAIQKQDFAVVQSMVSLGSFLYVVGLLLTDISYTLADPRVRLE